MTDIRYSYFTEFKRITVITDRSCYLWLRWSKIGPIYEPRIVYRRGLPLRGDKHISFHPWGDIAQNEPYDTTRHTFNLPYDLLPEGLWYFFSGNIAGLYCPSRSPFFFQYMPEYIPEEIMAKFKMFAGGFPRSLTATITSTPSWHFGDISQERSATIHAQAQITITDPDGNPHGPPFWVSPRGRPPQIPPHGS